MVELLLSAPAPVCLAVMLTLLLCLALVCLPLVAARPIMASPPVQAFRQAYLRTVALALPLLLVLSGCGTAPSRADPSPRVPAELLTPPQEPVMLTPASPSTRPGPTTSRTQAAAASIASTTGG